MTADSEPRCYPDPDATVRWPSSASGGAPSRSTTSSARLQPPAMHMRTRRLPAALLLGAATASMIVACAGVRRRPRCVGQGRGDARARHGADLVAGVLAEDRRPGGRRHRSRRLRQQRRRGRTGPPPGWPTLRVWAVGFDVRDPSHVFAGTDGSGVYVSTDSGATWSPSSTGLADRTVRSFAFGSDGIAAGTNHGVALSPDGSRLARRRPRPVLDLLAGDRGQHTVARAGRGHRPRGPLQRLPVPVRDVGLELAGAAERAPVGGGGHVGRGRTAVELGDQAPTGDHHLQGRVPQRRQRGHLDREHRGAREPHPHHRGDQPARPLAGIRRGRPGRLERRRPAALDRRGVVVHRGRRRAADRQAGGRGARGRTGDPAGGGGRARSRSGGTVYAQTDTTAPAPPALVAEAPGQPIPATLATPPRRRGPRRPPGGRTDARAGVGLGQFLGSAFHWPVPLVFEVLLVLAIAYLGGALAAAVLRRGPPVAPLARMAA